MINTTYYAYQVTECWGWSRGLSCSFPNDNATRHYESTPRRSCTFLIKIPSRISLTLYCRSCNTSVMAFNPRCSLPIWQKQTIQLNDLYKVFHSFICYHWIMSRLRKAKAGLDLAVGTPCFFLCITFRLSVYASEASTGHNSHAQLSFPELPWPLQQIATPQLWSNIFWTEICLKSVFLPRYSRFPQCLAEIRK